MEYLFEKYNKVGIFKLTGKLTSEDEDELKLLLMRAVYSIDRSVLNLKEVKSINERCLKLFQKAYCLSLRLRNPIILTEVPEKYIRSIFNCANQVVSEELMTSGTDQMKHIIEITGTQG